MHAARAPRMQKAAPARTNTVVPGVITQGEAWTSAVATLLEVFMAVSNPLLS